MAVSRRNALPAEGQCAWRCKARATVNLVPRGKRFALYRLHCALRYWKVVCPELGPQGLAETREIKQLALVRLGGLGIRRQAWSGKGPCCYATNC